MSHKKAYLFVMFLLHILKANLIKALPPQRTVTQFQNTHYFPTSLAHPFSLTSYSPSPSLQRNGVVQSLFKPRRTWNHESYQCAYWGLHYVSNMAPLNGIIEWSGHV